MNPRQMLSLARKAIRKPPGVVLARAASVVRRAWEAETLPRFGSRLAISSVHSDVGTRSLEELWIKLARRPYPAFVGHLDPADLERLCPGEMERILARAELALRHEIDLLGSGPTSLGRDIDWHRDYKSGARWPPQFFGNLRYGDPSIASDVKVPWEISRLQWLIPVAQAFCLTRDERYAYGVRDVLDQWMDANAFGCSVNWTCTMEVALRILTWSWLFHSCSGSRAWSDTGFRERFLVSLYEHGHFTDAHLELSDVNGNHYTADAAGLVFAGLFFGGRTRSQRWARHGWQILEKELPRQVFRDGVDFEASVAYHRLVLELFLLPAAFRAACGCRVPEVYRDRIVSMARFTEAYCTRDGDTPLWGDADDARALPFGTQALNDHRYLIGWIGAFFGVADLVSGFSGPRGELVWLLGPDTAARLPSRSVAATVAESVAFTDGGCFVMRTHQDHVFIDCGPVGLGGRGGHGHNDCLSFTAVLDGVPLVTDCGAYIYTGSYTERNRFRSTAYHNTPQVDGEEQNRFISPNHLWNLSYDARPNLRAWQSSSERSIFIGSHAGYERLPAPVTPVRTIVLDGRNSQLLVTDSFEGNGAHEIRVPLHLSPGVEPSHLGQLDALLLSAGGRQFMLYWWGAWEMFLEKGRVSPSYGRVHVCDRIVWIRKGTLGENLTVLIRPRHSNLDEPRVSAELLARAASAHAAT